MKNTVLYSISLLLAAGSNVLAAVGDPGVPPSSRNRYPSTTTQSNPYQQGQYQLGNDIVTGNVTGGKHFRGVVPYGSAYEFRGVQGSSTLNDFYRRAASVPKVTSPGYQSRPQRYYLPSSSVTSTGSESPANVQDNTYRLKSVDNQINLTGSSLEKLELESDYQSRQSYIDRLTKRPLRRDMYDVKRGLDKYLQPQEDDDMLDPVAQTKTSERLSKALEKSERDKDTLFSPLLKGKYDTELTRQKKLEYKSRFPDPEPFKPDSKKRADDKEITEPDVFQRMQQQFQEQVAEQSSERIAREKQEKLEQQQAKEEAEQKAIAKILTESAIGDDESAAITEPVEDMGTITTFAVDTEDDFNKYMSQAEKFLKDKMFYKAADAYALASAYNNENPLPYVGRSIALFGAGEYMSSSYYLDIALRIFKQLALFDIDIEGMIGDEDLFEKRSSELIELQIQSGSPELNFLRAYIYLSAGRLRNAQESINDAAEKLPENKAVDVLKSAIEQRR